MKRILTAVTVTLGVTASVHAPVAGQGPALAMLDRLEAGSWELRYRDDAGRTERICLRDGRVLIQMRHPGARCRQTIIDDTPTLVTVQYMCPGLGYGRTQVRRETDRLVQVDSQGIVSGAPFAFAAEARHLGRCP